MGMWAEVKHALNSTLGTSNFKSLDKIILDNTRLVASDDVFYAYDGEWSSGGATSDTATNGWYKRTNSYIQFDRSGTVKFKGFVTDRATSSSGNGSTSTAIIRVVDETGTVVGSYGITLTISQATNNWYELDVPLNVEPGKKYKVDIQRTSSYMELSSNLVIGATLVFGSGQCILTT